MSAVVIRASIAIIMGWSAVRAASRHGVWFWSLAGILGVLSIFSAALAAAFIWLLVCRRDDVLAGTTR